MKCEANNGGEGWVDPPRVRLWPEAMEGREGTGWEGKGRWGMGEGRDDQKKIRTLHSLVLTYSPRHIPKGIVAQADAVIDAPGLGH